MTAAAFFDLDRTVMAGASTWYFGAAALKHGLYSRRALVRDAREALAFARNGSTDESAAAVREHILKAIRGLRRADTDELVPDVLGPILGRVHRDVYLRILEHERAGTRTYLCSATPFEILLPIARALSMTGGVLGTVAAVDDAGLYTGELAAPFCYGDGKRLALVAEAEAEGFDLDECYAYSDSASDLPMLEAVGHPVVVNPDRELRVVADERGWAELPVTPTRTTWRRRAAVTAAVSLAAGFALGRSTRHPSFVSRTGRHR